MNKTDSNVDIDACLGSCVDGKVLIRETGFKDND